MTAWSRAARTLDTEVSMVNQLTPSSAIMLEEFRLEAPNLSCAFAAIGLSVVFLAELSYLPVDVDVLGCLILGLALAGIAATVAMAHASVVDRETLGWLGTGTTLRSLGSPSMLILSCCLYLQPSL